MRNRTALVFFLLVLVVLLAGLGLHLFGDRLMSWTGGMRGLHGRG